MINRGFGYWDLPQRWEAAYGVRRGQENSVAEEGSSVELAKPQGGRGDPLFTVNFGVSGEKDLGSRAVAWGNEE